MSELNDYLAAWERMEPARDDIGQAVSAEIMLRLLAAEAKLEVIHALHLPKRTPRFDACVECGQEYPCHTILILNGDKHD